MVAMAAIPRSRLVTPSVPQFIDGVHIEQRPDLEFPIRDRVTHVRHGGASRHRPVDPADIVLAGSVDPGFIGVRARSRQQAQMVTVRKPSSRRTIVNSSLRRRPPAPACAGELSGRSGHPPPTTPPRRTGARTPENRCGPPWARQSAAGATGPDLGGGKLGSWLGGGYDTGRSQRNSGCDTYGGWPVTGRGELFVACGVPDGVGAGPWRRSVR